MPPLYKKALVIGATSGIGEALASKLLAAGTSVVVSGRRQERLDAFVSRHKTDAATDADTSVSAIALDVTQLEQIPSFAASVARDHPDLDCVVLNSGIQRLFDFARPGSVDLGVFGDELLTNYISYVHLVTALLPHLQGLGKKDNIETHLVFVSASLGLVPALLRTPGYNASKAALHCWVTALRQQLKDSGDRVRVVEVFPPAVQTELHGTWPQPGTVDTGEIGMPLQAYTDKMYEGLERGNEQFAIGHAEAWLQEGGFEAQREKLFQQQHPVVTDALAKYFK